MQLGSPIGDKGEYKYVGMPLQPSIFAEILLHRFDGKQFKREQAIDDVVKFHEMHGGNPVSNNAASIFKKASSYLKDYGLENVNYGYWKLSYQTPHSETEIITSDDPSDSSPLSERKIESYANKIIGTGEASVYLYYFDTYKKIANLLGHDTWPCKIGRTDKDPLTRVISQSQTVFPEMPHIALIIRCDDSSTLESAIHGILKIRNQWIQKAPGTEWFETNPQQVTEIYSTIIGDTNRDKDPDK